MSALNAYCFTGTIGTAAGCFNGANLRPSGPELNAPYKVLMGYVSSSRVLTLTPALKRQTRTVNLAAINRPEANGALMVKIPVNDGIVGHYYGIEFRQRSGWDAGIPQDTVLIHEVKPDPNNSNYLTSYLQTTQGSSQFLANSTFTAGGITITVNAINTAESTATVTVTY
jgi:hypothetical protein